MGHKLLRGLKKSLRLGIALAAALNAARAGPPISVPLKLSQHLAVVTVKIDGMDVPLMLDSGDQSALALRQSVLDQIRAVPVSESFKGQDIKGIFQAREYRVSQVRIGEATFSDVIARLDAHSPSNIPVELGQQGLVGTGLFKSYQVVIDYRNRKMTLVADRSASTLCRGTSVPFSPLPPNNQPREPLTEADTDLGAVMLWWDTGAQASTVSRRFVVQGHAKLAKDDSFTSRRLSLGGQDFGPWRFATADLSLPPFFDGFVGYDFFARHVVCFDFPNKQLLIQR